MGANAFMFEDDTVVTPEAAPATPEAAFDFAAFAPSKYKGDTPARKDVIKGRLPVGKLTILAGAGDVGKSWLLLDTAERIGHSDRYAFGGEIAENYRGKPCVILFGEDDKESIDLRLKVIRQGRGSKALKHGAYIAGPDAAKPLQLVEVVFGTDNVAPTPFYHELEAYLTELNRKHGCVAFVAIDTLSTCIPVDANKPHLVQNALNLLTSLAARQKVAIVLTHHLSKGDPKGSKDLRKLIRGSTAVVDAARAAYVMEKLDGGEADRLKNACGIEGVVDIVRMPIVKNNLGLNSEDILFARRFNGLLADVTTQCKGLRGQQKMELLTVVAGFNARGEKVTKTGSSSLYELRAQDWPDSIRTLARDKLAELVDLLIAEGELQSSPKEGLQVAGK